MEQNKLAIISSDGEIAKRGDRKDEKLPHAICLLEYIKEKYPNNETLKKLNFRHTPNIIGFFLTLYGNAILFNTTKHEEKYGKSLYLLMPATLTESHQRSLEELLESTPSYSLTIAYNMKVTNGVLDGQELSPVEKIPPIQVLEMYYKKVGIERKKGDVII
ncbi:MAG: hypothetical protein HFH08_05310 [Bacilli bacterium]|nr:hypothetical protein [Bacilli bacterium]